MARALRGDDDPLVVFYYKAIKLGDVSTVALIDKGSRAKGVDATWLPVAGGGHTNAWAQPSVIDQIFDFFDAHRKKG